MTLGKPDGEECGNCYYCISRTINELTESRLFKPDKYIEVEQFYCKRYPETEYKYKESWCGEWRERKGEQQQ